MTGTTTATRTLRLGTREAARGTGGGWEGVLRDGRKVILTCGHRHHNRDTSTQASGVSARNCIATLLKSARYPGYAAQVAGQIRNSVNGYVRAYATTASHAERLRANASEAAAAFLASLPAAAEAIGNEPVYGYTNHIDVAPVPPQDVTCKHCGEHIEPQRYAVNEYVDGWFDWRAMPGYGVYCPARGTPSYEGHEPADA